VAGQSHRSGAAESLESSNGMELNECRREWMPSYKMLSVVPTEPVTALQNQICEMRSACLLLFEF